MHKFLIVFIMLALHGSTAWAQPKGFRAVGDENLFRKNYAKAAETTTSIKSSFRQEKNLSMLAEKINSDGLFYFKKTNKVRMEYTKPYKYLLIINNDKILIQNQQKKKVYSSGDNKLFKVINNVIMDCVQGRALQNKNFQAKVFENDKSYCLNLVPQAKEIKPLFSSIRIYIGKNDFSIDQLEMKEKMGDTTIITFVNKQLNTAIDDEVFSVK